MKKSIFIKILSGYIFIAIALILLILTFSFRIIRAYYISALTDDLARMGTVLNTRILPFIEKNDTHGLDAYVKDLDVRIHRRITIIDPRGTVLADSESDPQRMENHAGRPEVIQALRGAVGTSVRQSSTIGEEMLYIALPLESSGSISGVTRISIHIRDVNTLLKHLKISLARLSAIAFLLSLLTAYLFSKSISRPITRLSGAARKVAAGDFTTKVFIESRDELKDLGDNFNHMTEQLRVSFAQLSRQKDELQAIVASLQEGLFVIGADDKIILSNESFNKYTRAAASDGRFYWEVLRAPRFKDMMRAAVSSSSPVTDTLEYEGGMYLCSITPMGPRHEYIVVLHDITQIKNLETIKKDLVGNVSHELRTPLTAMKGYLETIETTLDGENRRYLDIVRRHTDRLIRIVEDLLLLSELEGKGFRLEYASVDIAALLSDVARIFEQRVKAAGLNLELRVEPGMPALRGDAFKLEQVFINLIDNAVKYTEKGSISIHARKGADTINIDVADTGIGIPREHLSRIFERFYVVDKSRSRTAGGTGLGLSIVKHIILLHNGTLDVHSEQGAGTSISVHLPLETGQRNPATPS